MKRLAFATATLVATLEATASAQEATPTATATPTSTSTSTSTSISTATSTPTSTATASPPPLPTATPVARPYSPQDFVPDPAVQLTPHWYGWQPMIFDLAALGQGALGYALDATPLYVTAGVTYVFGPLGVHLYHGRIGNITLAAITRLVAPSIGAGFGVLVAGPHSSDSKPIALGIGIGCLVAAIIDDAFISHEMLQFWERNGAITIAPQLSSRDGTRLSGFTLSGSF